MNYKILTVAAAVVFSFAFTFTDNKSNSETIDSEVIVSTPTTPEISFDATVENMYNVFLSKNATMPNLEVFANGIKGYTKLEEEGKVSNNLLTIVDFGLSSTMKRMWILDMKEQKVLFNTYTSHGKNTGGEFATKFSNTLNSLQSSLGFFVTGETYYGKNGLSLFIDGMEKGINDNARKRYVVIHGADYAMPKFIKRHGRLGRSYGCPAVPNNIAKDVIDLIKGESVVYLHKNDNNYMNKSTFLN